MHHNKDIFKLMLLNESWMFYAIKMKVFLDAVISNHHQGTFVSPFITFA